MSSENSSHQTAKRSHRNECGIMYHTHFHTDFLSNGGLFPTKNGRENKKPAILNTLRPGMVRDKYHSGAQRV